MVRPSFTSSGSLKLRVIARRTNMAARARQAVGRQLDNSVIQVGASLGLQCIFSISAKAQTARSRKPVDYIHQTIDDRRWSKMQDRFATVHRTASESY